MPSGLKVNLGCGSNVRPGWVNVDRVALPGVDVVGDITKVAAQLPDGSCSHVLMSHSAEHLPPVLPDGRDTFLVLMEDLHRILEPGGHVEIIVPHYKDHLRMRDPTHYRTFHRRTMEYFSAQDPNHYYTSAVFEEAEYGPVFSPRWPLSRVYLGGRGVFFWLCEKPVVRWLVGRRFAQRWLLQKPPVPRGAAAAPTASPRSTSA